MLNQSIFNAVQRYYTSLSISDILEPMYKNVDNRSLYYVLDSDMTNVINEEVYMRAGENNVAWKSIEHKN